MFEETSPYPFTLLTSKPMKGNCITPDVANSLTTTAARILVVMLIVLMGFGVGR